MNEISIFNPEGRKQCDLTVRFGDYFQSVTIKKSANRVAVAEALHKLADNLVFGFTVDGTDLCKTCASWKPESDGSRYGQCSAHHCLTAEAHICEVYIPRNGGGS